MRLFFIDFIGIDLKEKAGKHLKHKAARLCEGAIMVALATALSYLKLLELPQGGSVCIGMLPIFLYSARWGVGPAFLTSFAHGLLQLLLDGAYAWGPTSMLLDYLLAFGVLGVAGFFHGKKGGVYVGTVIGCVCRFIVHFISGTARSTRSIEPTELLLTPTFHQIRISILQFTTAATCSQHATRPESTTSIKKTHKQSNRTDK